MDNSNNRNCEWALYYYSKVITVEGAIRLVKSGDRVFDGHGVGRPLIFSKSLVSRAEELEKVEIICGFTLGEADYCKPEYSKSFIHNSVFNVPATREAHWNGRAEFTPVNMSDLENLFTTKLPADILFTHVTKPDENGYVSLGVSVDYTRTLIEKAKIVIAQVNENMPWTEGEGIVHISNIDYFVEDNTPIPEILPSKDISEVDRAIAENIASLVNDGDTIQTGVGSIPDTVLSLLKNHKDIGIHTELASNGIMEMIKRGVITNEKKSIDKGKVICTLMGGTRDFYDFVNHNKQFEMRRVSYVNNPLIISQQKNMCAMNSAIQVDLFGQVCSDMIGNKQFSGVGGQLDFLRGAAMAENGKSIICLPSTAAKGTISRIVTYLDKGACVTDTRYDVMYIVSEYGIANLWGKTNSQRARDLIDIAHPDFRERLEREYYEKIVNVGG